MMLFSVGLGSCESNTGQISLGSCIGSRVCVRNTGDISDGSCIAGDGLEKACVDNTGGES